MTQIKIYPKKLLVEGAEDKRVIPYLIEANGISWGENKEEAIVLIEVCGSKTELLNRYEISTQLQNSGLSALGLMVDAG